MQGDAHSPLTHDNMYTKVEHNNSPGLYRNIIMVSLARPLKRRDTHNGRSALELVIAQQSGSSMMEHV